MRVLKIQREEKLNSAALMTDVSIQQSRYERRIMEVSNTPVLFPFDHPHHTTTRTATKPSLLCHAILYSRVGREQIYAQLSYRTDVFQEADCITLSKMSDRNQYCGRNF